METKAIIMQKPIQKKTRGRQKIEIKQIQVQSNLQVTFSKRRSGLIKKASELSLLCGSQVAVIAFSPGNKAFAFGNPDVDHVLNRYLAEVTAGRAPESAEAKNGAIITTSTSDPHVQQLNKEYMEALKELEAEKQRKLVIEERTKKGAAGGFHGRFWWDEPIEHMSMDELEEHRRALRELRRNVSSRLNELMAGGGHHLMDVNGGGGSGGASTSGGGGGYMGDVNWG